MSLKRQATTELTDRNWDQDDPADHEDMGTFKPASQDVLEKRVIRTAKRRSHLSSGDEAKKGVFNSFGGFKKTQPSSFDFLANLTNGAKSASSANGDTPTTSASNSKPSSLSSGGLFTAQTSPLSSKPFGSTTSSLFGTSSNTNSSPTTFSLGKTDSAVGNIPFKIPTSTTDSSKETKAIAPSTNANNIFGTSNTSNNSSIFSNIANKSTTFQLNPSPTISVQNNSTPKKLNSEESSKQDEDKKLKYYAKLKGLNESVADWIKKNVEETPLCILTPIFRDYEKFLKEMQAEHQGKPIEENGTNTDKKTEPPQTLFKDIKDTPVKTNAETSTFTSPTSKPSLFSSGNISNTSEKSTFSFGVKPSAPTTSVTTNSGFSFGTTQSTTTIAASTTSSFSFGSNIASTNTSTAAPFSFGIVKPFSFNTNIKTNSESKPEEKDADDEPPKVDVTPIVEENSVFDKRCKIFFKKDGNFVDNGVGTLYIKKIEETGKHQLLVRANTNLGNVLVNLILGSAIPTQRMGKNNVMLVCHPTPVSEPLPPPTPILIRVKTSEEADELLETLNKYKA